jgi:hypothetical protein
LLPKIATGGSCTTLLSIATNAIEPRGTGAYEIASIPLEVIHMSFGATVSAKLRPPPSQHTFGVMADLEDKLDVLIYPILRD